MIIGHVHCDAGLKAWKLALHMSLGGRCEPEVVKSTQQTDMEAAMAYVRAAPEAHGEAFRARDVTERAVGRIYRSFLIREGFLDLEGLEGN